MELKLSQIHLTKELAILTMQRLLRRKSTWFLALMGMFPAAIAIFWILKIFLQFNANDTPYSIYHGTMSIFHLTFFVPILGIFMGLGVISDEIETKNITFTLVRPLSRTAIVAGRFLGHYLAALACVVIGVSITYFANMVFQPQDMFGQLPKLVNTLFVMAYGLLGFMGITSFMGTVWKKFAVLGCFIWIVFDLLFGHIPVNTLNGISIRYHMLAGFWEPAVQFLPTASITSGSALMHGLACALFAVIAAAIMVWRISAFELSLSSSDN